VPPVNDSFWLTAEASGWFGRESTYEGKRSHAPRARASASTPLSAMVELVFDESIDVVDLRELSGQEAFLLLSKAHICYPTGSGAEAVRDLESRARLGGAVPAFRLRRPRRLDMLDALERVVASRLHDSRVPR
jgi:hypothetical protein